MVEAKGGSVSSEEGEVNSEDEEEEEDNLKRKQKKGVSPPQTKEFFVRE